jgi:hypothetical protein
MRRGRPREIPVIENGWKGGQRYVHPSSLPCPFSPRWSQGASGKGIGMARTTNIAEGRCRNHILDNNDVNGRR